MQCAAPRRRFPSENLDELPKEALDSCKPGSACGLPNAALSEVDSKAAVAVIPDPVVLPGPEPFGGRTPFGQFPGEPGVWRQHAHLKALAPLCVCPAVARMVMHRSLRRCVNYKPEEVELSFLQTRMSPRARRSSLMKRRGSRTCAPWA